MSVRVSLRRAIGRAWLRAFGWTADDRGLGVRKAVLIAAPHTSNWDLPFMLAFAYVLDLDVRWLGKHTLFAPPFGGFMRWIGGVPVDRRARTGLVAAGVAALRDAPTMILAVPPEGTRARAPHWKTGFYAIASGAQVPILFGYLDYATKRGGVGGVLHPTGDIGADMDVLRAFYRSIRGKFPEKESDVLLREERT